jgi:hypothetical protein
MDKQETRLKHQYRVYCGEMDLQRGISARELETTAAYRLGVFMRWMENPQEGD